MIEKTFTTEKPLKIEGIEELAKNFDDNEWRELRIYFRRVDTIITNKISTALVEPIVEIRYGQQLNIVKLGTN